MRLVEMPPERDTGERSAGYWKADYDATDHKFKNITAAPTADGIYNMFGLEVSLARFVNDVPLVRYGFLNFQTADVDELGQGMKLRMRAYTDGSDHNWAASVAIALNREKTC